MNQYLGSLISPLNSSVPSYVISMPMRVQYVLQVELVPFNEVYYRTRITARVNYQRNPAILVG